MLDNTAQVDRLTLRALHPHRRLPPIVATLCALAALYLLALGVMGPDDLGPAPTLDTVYYCPVEHGRQCVGPRPDNVPDNVRVYRQAMVAKLHDAWVVDVEAERSRVAWQSVQLGVAGGLVLAMLVSILIGLRIRKPRVVVDLTPGRLTFEGTDYTLDEATSIAVQDARLALVMGDGERRLSRLVSLTEEDVQLVERIDGQLRQHRSTPVDDDALAQVRALRTPRTEGR